MPTAGKSEIAVLRKTLKSGYLESRCWVGATWLWQSCVSARLRPHRRSWLLRQLELTRLEPLGLGASRFQSGWLLKAQSDERVDARRAGT